MRRILGLSLLIFMILMMGIGCDKKNPIEPKIINSINRVYSSVHLVGSFNNWDISNPVNSMIFQGNNQWSRTISLTSGSYEFKFATGYSWDNDNFGDNDTPDSGSDPVVISGTGDNGGGNISLSITSAGYYTFTFNDKTHEYSVESSGYVPEFTDYTVNSISSSDTFIFKCNVTDQDGTVTWVKVHYWDETGGPNIEQIETLTNTTGDTYVSTVKTPTAEGQFTYYFEARDNEGNTSYFPSDAPTSKEIVVVSDQVIVDGIIDSIYGAPIAQDSSADGNGNDPMDLVDLYVYDDTENYYFLFTIDADINGGNNWGKYVIYIDTTNDTGGATLDAWGRAVIVNETHEPEYGIYCWVDSATFNTASVEVYSWDGSTWNAESTVSEAAMVTGSSSVIEYRISKTALGNPGQIWLEVWSTGNGVTDNAQDTINNPAEDWNAVDWTTTSDLDCTTNYTTQN